MCRQRRPCRQSPDRGGGRTCARRLVSDRPYDDASLICAWGHRNHPDTFAGALSRWPRKSNVGPMNGTSPSPAARHPTERPISAAWSVMMEHAPGTTREISSANSLGNLPSWRISPVHIDQTRRPRHAPRRRAPRRFSVAAIPGMCYNQAQMSKTTKDSAALRIDVSNTTDSCPAAWRGAVLHGSGALADRRNAPPNGRGVLSDGQAEATEESATACQILGIMRNSESTGGQAASGTRLSRE